MSNDLSHDELLTELLTKSVVLKPDFFHNWPPVGRNRFLPVIERLLSTDNLA